MQITHERTGADGERRQLIVEFAIPGAPTERIDGSAKVAAEAA